MKTNNLFKNQIWLFISIIIILLSLSCKTHLKENYQLKNRKIENSESIITKDGFVVDCGSGCAMVYNIEKVNIAGLIYKVKFKVLNYINEEIVDELHQIYFFEYEKDGKLISIYLNGNKENILMDNNIIMKNDIKNLGERLWRDKNSSEESHNDNTKVQTKKK